MADPTSARHISHATVEVALRALVGTTLKTKSDSMLRTFLAFKAVHRNGSVSQVDSSALKTVVEELFTLIPTPDGTPENKFTGTIALRGSRGGPSWLRNDSHRGAFLDYAGPNGPGRLMFQDADWRKPILNDAVDRVTETLGPARYGWPSRQAVTAIALRNQAFDSDLNWQDLTELARERFGLTSVEWEAVTSTDPLGLDPYEGAAWDPAELAPDLRPPGIEKAEESAKAVEDLPSRLRSQVERVLRALDKHGGHAIVALAGVPGTSKSHVAKIAARTFASDDCLREIQFSPGYTYEEFMEGPRYGEGMEIEVCPGAFLEMNKRAIDDPSRQYVFLIEELTRADLPRVLGELLTFVEYRDETDRFTTMYRRDTDTRIAPNVAVLATYNPSDRSAVNVDAALLRRMRILSFSPDTQLLAEILDENGVDPQVVAALAGMFDACREATGPERFEEVMPFGHAVFASVEDERNLYELWDEELRHMLVRPHTPRHELYDVILSHYPWHVSPDVSVVTAPDEPSDSPSDAGAQTTAPEGPTE